MVSVGNIINAGVSAARGDDAGTIFGNLVGNTSSTSTGSSAGQTISDPVEVSQLIIRRDGDDIPFEPRRMIDLSPRERVPELTPGQDGNLPITSDQLITNLLRDNPGIFIGERHGPVENLRYAEENMELFAQNGVKAFFLEYIPSKDQEKFDGMVERYMESKDPKELIDYFNGLSDGQFAANDNAWAKQIVKTIEAAVENGIDVVGIDARPQDASNSMAIRNRHWADTVNERMEQYPPGSRAVVFGGAGHSSDPEHVVTDPENDVSNARNLGADALLGYPSIDLYGSGLNQSDGMEPGDVRYNPDRESSDFLVRPE